MAMIDWVVLGIYLIIVIALGTWFARRQKTTEEYFIGGRSVAWWAVGLSFFGTSISTATFIAIPGQGYGGDWIPHLQHFMLPVAAVFIVLVVVPFYRGMVKMSAYEYLQKRFGYGARCYTAVVYLIGHLFRMGIILFLMAGAVHTMTGWNIYTIVIISGIVAVVYTVLGGLEAVIWTDVLQSVTLFGGCLLCLGFLLFGTEGGPGQLFQIAHDADKFRLADLSFDLTEPTILVTMLYGLLIYSNNYTVNQEAVQRYLAVSSTRQAQKAIWLGSVGCFLSWNLFALIGTLLYSYYQIHPDQLPAEVASHETQVFPYFVMSRLPAGVSGMILAGMCAAAMSSLDTTINSMALVSVRDLYLPFRRTATDRWQLFLGKVSSFVWGAVGIVVGILLVGGVEQALKFTITTFSILGGGLFGLFMLAFFVRRAHSLGVYIGLAFGVLISAWGILDVVLQKMNEVLALSLSEQWIDAVKFPLHPWMVFFCANLATFVIGWAASLILPDISKRDPSGLTFFDRANAEEAPC